MELNKQSQKATGDYTVQNQTFIYNNGITEERVREICDEKIKQIIAQYTEVAHTIVNERLNDFRDIIIPMIKGIKNGLSAFTDPSFQFLLGETYKVAACTENKTDYELLSELLAHRIEKGDDKGIKLSVHKAVQIVEDLPDDALQGLTLFYVVKHISAQHYSVITTLNILEETFKQIMYSELPLGNEWIEYLNMCGAVRIIDSKTFSKIKNIYTNYYQPILQIGIKKDSEQYQKALNILKKADIDINESDVLVPNEYCADYVRVSLFSKDRLNLKTATDSNGSERELNNMEKQAICSIFDLYDQDKKLKEEMKKFFICEFDKRPHLKKLEEWFNSIPLYFDTTNVGKVLGKANAHLHCLKIPGLIINENII